MMGYINVRPKADE